MNTRRKGNETRLKAKKYFERQGFVVRIVENSHKYSKEKDLYGVADLIMIRKGQVVFVQVATNKAHDHEKYLKFKDEFGLNIWQVILNTKNKSWTTIKYKGSEHDERVNWKRDTYLD